MCCIAVDVPERVLKETCMSKNETVAFAKKALAMAYYCQSGLSVGYCAEVAGLSEEEFIKYLGKNHVSIFEFAGEGEFLEEAANA